MKNSVSIFLCLLCMIAVSAFGQTPQMRTQKVRDFISGEEIFLYEAYRIPGKHGWYIKQHSPQACRLYKSWYDDYQEKYKALQQQLLQRYVKESNKVKKNKHSARFAPKCSVWGCKKSPVFSEFGLVEVRERDGKRDCRHYECAEMERLRIKDAEILYKMGITHDFCQDVFESMEKEKQEEGLSVSIRDRDTGQEVLVQDETASPVQATRKTKESVEDAQKNLQRFSYKYRKELQQIRRVFAESGREDVALLSPQQQDIYAQFQQHRDALLLEQ